MVDHAEAVTRIDFIIKAIATPKWDAVFSGEPTQLTNGPCAAYWYNGDTPYGDGKTLGNVMVTEHFTIRAYFPFADAPSLRKTIEIKIWDAVRNLKSGFRGDSDLNSLVTDLDIGDANVEWLQLTSGAIRRIVTFDLMLHDLEAESIVK